MPETPRICVVIPVFNHAQTVGRVAQDARTHFTVIVVNDGSTDDTRQVLALDPGLNVVTLPQNLGKGAALRAGFAKAEDLGFTHAITLDADGQHSPSALSLFAEATRSEPQAFVIGVRNLVRDGAPWPRRLSNRLSTFWFRMETGVPLADTQCGYRCYPLQSIRSLTVTSQHYAFELEIMVKAAWAGVPLVALPVSADYTAPTSRLSHFHPWRDMARISCLHSWLAIQAFCVPAPLRKLAALGALSRLPRASRTRTILSHLGSEHTETPGRLAFAVGLGLFCGIAPIWGFQMLTAAALAHTLRLNKAIALAASNVSFPLAAPFILAAGLLLGHYLRTGTLLRWNPDAVTPQIPLYFADWFAGSVVLALVAGALGTIVTWALGCVFARNRKKTPDG